MVDIYIFASIMLIFHKSEAKIMNLRLIHIINLAFGNIIDLLMIFSLNI
jgi:lipoprotein signal peptidase